MSHCQPTINDNYVKLIIRRVINTDYNLPFSTKIMLKSPSLLFSRASKLAASHNYRNIVNSSYTYSPGLVQKSDRRELIAGFSPGSSKRLAEETPLPDSVPAGS